MRQDEHKRALVAHGKEMLGFFRVSEDEEEVLTDADFYGEGATSKEINLIAVALDSV